MQLVLGRLWDRILASDPGLNRLMFAVRVTLAVMLTTLVLRVFTEALHLPTAFVLLGSLTALQVSLAVNDPQARTTTLLTIIPSAISLTLASFLSSRALASDLLFLVVLFISVATRAYGPRWTALGVIAVVTYFFTLFVGATIDMLPVLFPAVFSGIACTFFVRFVLFPERPRWIAERTVHAFKARVRVTTAAAHDLINGADTLSARTELASATARLNETAVSIEGRLSANDVASMRAVFDVELAAEEIASATVRIKETGALAPRALRLALLAMSRERTEHATTLAAAFPHGASANEAAQTLAAAIVNLGRALPHIDAVVDVLARSDALWGFGPGQQQPALRQAIQITLASAAAIIVGETLSPQRWYWAVLAAFFVFTGTASSGETIARAWSRIVGTMIGVMVGVVAGRFAQHHAYLSVAAIFLCLFSGVYLLRVSYAMMIFFITAVLAMLYAEFGNFSYALLGIRLVETIVGAMFGAMAACMILPTRTDDVIRTHMRETLAAAGAAVHACITELTDRRTSGGALEAARDAENHVQQLVLRAKTGFFWSYFSTKRDALRERIIALNACSYCVRALAREVHRRTDPLPTDLLPPLRALDARLQEHLRAAAQRIDGGAEQDIDNATALFEEIYRTAEHDTTAALAEVLRTLEHLDHVVIRLTRNDGAPLPL
jgi:uncharacterized membrane protein YgaE (UPF0421/DUF939 family)